MDAARALDSEDLRADALRALAPHLPAELLPQALEAARAIDDESWRADALQALAPRLPAEVLPQALETARAFADKRWRARVLGALAPHLPEDEQPAVWLEALDADHAIILKVSYDEALLVPHLIAEPAANLQHLQATLRMTAARGRPALLQDLSTLMPWLASLATTEHLRAYAAAIRDAAHCWP